MANSELAQTFADLTETFENSHILSSRETEELGTVYTMEHLSAGLKQILEFSQDFGEIRFSVLEEELGAMCNILYVADVEGYMVRKKCEVSGRVESESDTLIVGLDNISMVLEVPVSLHAKSIVKMIHLLEENRENINSPTFLFKA